MGDEEEEKLTLQCPFEIALQEVDDDEIVPNFVLNHVLRVIEDGKTTCAIDSVSGDTLTYQEFVEDSRKMAINMYKKGMRKGDTAIYLTTHMLKLSTFFMGCWRANGTLRASYPEDTEDTLCERVEESRAGWLLCDPMTAPMCLNVAEKMYWDVEVITTGEFEGCTSLNDLFAEDDTGQELPELIVTGSHPALVLCTSGTTGKSKGAVHTHRSIVNTLCAAMKMPFPESNLLVTKGTHITGSIFPLSILCSGKLAITMSVFSKKNMFEAVQNYRPGLIWGFPTFLLLLVNDPEASQYDFSSIELAATGGAQVTPAMENTMTKLTNCRLLLNCYGLSEVIPLLTEINFDDPVGIKLPDVPPFCIGKVCPRVSIQVRDPDTLKVLGPNERGEICAKSPAMFSHYINNNEATEKAFVDGWFRTGDLGYYDESEFVFLVDRLKEIFKYWNNHISPTEVEEVINQHEAVAEVCVVGVKDLEGGGHVPRAYVTLLEPCPPEEIIQFANERLASYKHLRGGLYIVDELPKGKTGKIQRSLVSQMTLPEEEPEESEQIQPEEEEGVKEEEQEQEESPQVDVNLDDDEEEEKVEDVEVQVQVEAQPETEEENEQVNEEQENQNEEGNDDNLDVEGPENESNEDENGPVEGPDNLDEEDEQPKDDQEKPEEEEE